MLDPRVRPGVSVEEGSASTERAGVGRRSSDHTAEVVKISSTRCGEARPLFRVVAQGLSSVSVESFELDPSVRQRSGGLLGVHCVAAGDSLGTEEEAGGVRQSASSSRSRPLSRGCNSPATPRSVSRPIG